MCYRYVYFIFWYRTNAQHLCTATCLHAGLKKVLVTRKIRSPTWLLYYGKKVHGLFRVNTGTVYHVYVIWYSLPYLSNTESEMITYVWNSTTAKSTPSRLKNIFLSRWQTNVRWYTPQGNLIVGTNMISAVYYPTFIVLSFYKEIFMLQTYGSVDTFQRNQEIIASPKKLNVLKDLKLPSLLGAGFWKSLGFYYLCSCAFYSNKAGGQVLLDEKS